MGLIGIDWRAWRVVSKKATEEYLHHRILSERLTNSQALGVSDGCQSAA